MRSCGLFTPSHRPMTRRLWCLAVLSGVTPCVNNMALEANSVGVYQTSKLLLTPVIVAAEWTALRKPLSWRRGLMLAAVTLCATVSMATDFEITVSGAALSLGEAQGPHVPTVLHDVTRHRVGTGIPPRCSGCACGAATPTSCSWSCMYVR